ncbi:MAG: hypothetical protein P8Z00_25275 [Anaerolineales bacterium]
MIDAITYVGFFVVPLGLSPLGIGMFGAPTFGKGFGGVTLVLGVGGLVAAVLQLIDPASMVGALSYFACLIFYFVLGWKVYRLSKAR